MDVEALDVTKLDSIVRVWKSGNDGTSAGYIGVQVQDKPPTCECLNDYARTFGLDEGSVRVLQKAVEEQTVSTKTRLLQHIHDAQYVRFLTGLRLEVALRRLLRGESAVGVVGRYDPMQPRDRRGRWTNSSSLALTLHNGSSSSSPGGKMPRKKPNWRNWFGLKTGDKVRENSTIDSFDEIHIWSGEELPEPESRRLQASKHEALQNLKDYAREDSKHEKAGVLLLPDGDLYRQEYFLGKKEEVAIKIPKRPVAIMHTHPVVLAHSLRDWQNFLLVEWVMQSHVITETLTYSLHKPPGWELPADATKDSVTKAYNTYKMKAALKALKSDGELNETRIRDEVEKKMSRKYGIIRRIGKRTR